MWTVLLGDLTCSRTQAALQRENDLLLEVQTLVLKITLLGLVQALWHYGSSLDYLIAMASNLLEPE